MSGPHGLERLSAAPVQEMVVQLEHRIAARFPDRGLRGVARDLTLMAGEVADNALETQRRLRSVRVAARGLSLVVVVATVAVLAVALRDAVRAGALSTFEWVPLVESIINDLVFAAIAVYFLYALPGRLARERLLTQLHRLRSLAHIVDMHQLTKDPERLRPGFRPTAESVDPGLSRDDRALSRLLLRASQPGRQGRGPVRGGVAGLRGPRDGEHHRDAADVDVPQDLAEDLAAPRLTTNRPPVASPPRRAGPRLRGRGRPARVATRR